ncbi:hypothetical protein WN51_01412 [Melipona quadrifasciata]|uniref:Uncharacterized protein n=1 Tax=Melipona quadrifasciata TaxID=166423 RepID=A0A0N0BEZ1_9HYME|nr:hypothetical protein WN51_01412 [Melipona quadrifasciata]
MHVDEKFRRLPVRVGRYIHLNKFETSKMTNRASRNFTCAVSYFILKKTRDIDVKKVIDLEWNDHYLTYYATLYENISACSRMTHGISDLKLVCSLEVPINRTIKEANSAFGNYFQTRKHLLLHPKDYVRRTPVCDIHDSEKLLQNLESDVQERPILQINLNTCSHRLLSKFRKE